MLSHTNTILQLSIAAFAVAIFGLCAQIYVRTILELNTIKDATTEYQDQDIEITTTTDNSVLPSLYELVYNDSRLSRFQQVLSEVPPVIFFSPEADGGITLFAPVDDAFTGKYFPWDLPYFYWMFLGLYHHIPGNFTQDDLKIRDTVPTHIWADIFDSYRQALSTQVSGLDIILSHQASIIQADVKARDGYLHYIDRILMLPESTAYIIRNNPEFSLFREGLDQSGLAVLVNDTSLHNGQTVFAPSNIAFKKLGNRVNKFLFSQWGQKCLRALLEYHVIANQTLFTNSHFRANGWGPGLSHDIEPGYELNLSTMINPLQVKTSIVKDGKRGKIIVNDAVHVVQSDIVVQDGVIHRIDDILLPPKNMAEHETDTESNSIWGEMWHKLFHSDQMTVEDLMDRFQPYIDQDLREKS